MIGHHRHGTGVLKSMGGSVVLVVPYLVLALIFLTPGVDAATSEATHLPEEVSASQASAWFFGQGIPAQERIRLAGLLEPIELRSQNSRKCGALRLDVHSKEELESLQDQLNQTIYQLKDMIKGGTITVAAVCYYKPNVCAHMRHFSTLLQEELSFQLDACKAIASVVDDQAERADGDGGDRSRRRRSGNTLEARWSQSFDGEILRHANGRDHEAPRLSH